jgi:hypothetical protein
MECRLYVSPIVSCNARKVLINSHLLMIIKDLTYWQIIEIILILIDQKEKRNFLRFKRNKYRITYILMHVIL